MSVPGIGPRFRTPRVRAIAVGCVVLAELAIALPFLFVTPSTVRASPGRCSSCSASPRPSSWGPASAPR